VFWFDVWFSQEHAMDPGRIGIGTACEDCMEVDIMIDAKHVEIHALCGLASVLHATW
jgi:hypothetical protein